MNELGPRALLSISFDDAHRSVANKAHPIMRSLGIPGTVYVVTSWVGQNEYMDSSELGAVRDDGWELASHSVSHRRMSRLNGEELEEELSVSARRIAGFNTSSKSAVGFAFPFGDSGSVGVREIRMASKFYKYVRLNGNRRGLLNPHHCHLDTMRIK